LRILRYKSGRLLSRKIDGRAVAEPEEKPFEINVPGMGRTRTGKIHRRFHKTDSRPEDSVNKQKAEISA